jgi:MFS family permease
MPIEPDSRHYAGIIALVALGKFIFGVDFGMMNVALATISADLHVDPVILPWIVSTYSLSYAGFLVLGGRAADTFDAAFVSSAFASSAWVSSSRFLPPMSGR